MLLSCSAEGEGQLPHSVSWQQQWLELWHSQAAAHTRQHQDLKYLTTVVGKTTSFKRIPGLALAFMLWEAQGYHVVVKGDTMLL